MANEVQRHSRGIKSSVSAIAEQRIEDIAACRREWGSTLVDWISEKNIEKN